jgi:hypothetical protein
MKNVAASLLILVAVVLVTVNLLLEVLVWSAWGLGRLPAGLGRVVDIASVENAFTALATVSVGILIIRTRPRNALGWLLLTIGAIIALSDLAFAYTALGLYEPSLQLPGVGWTALWAAATWPLPELGVCILLLIYPTGHLLTPRWRWAVGFAIAAVVPVSTVSALLTHMDLGEQTIANPIGLLDRSVLEPYLGLVFGFLIAGLAVSVIGMLVRYRRSSGVERQQMKWLLYVSALFVIATALNFFGASGDIPWLTSLVGLGFPIAIGIAILRYHLFDIDLIIRKTVTYGIVGVLLVVLYFASVVLFQQVFAAVSGQRSEVITVISTLMIAALFVPVRNRVQRVIDRRFYRGKYDAQRVLNEFSTTVRDETDLSSLTGKLIQVVQETMQPKSVSVWLGRADSGMRRENRR